MLSVPSSLSPKPLLIIFYSILYYIFLHITETYTASSDDDAYPPNAPKAAWYMSI